MARVENNGGPYKDLLTRPGLYTYKVCEAHTTNCSNQVRVTFPPVGDQAGNFNQGGVAQSGAAFALSPVPPPRPPAGAQQARRNQAASRALPLLLIYHAVVAGTGDPGR